MQNCFVSAQHFIFHHPGVFLPGPSVQDSCQFHFSERAVHRTRAFSHRYKFRNAADLRFPLQSNLPVGKIHFVKIKRLSLFTVDQRIAGQIAAALTLVLFLAVRTRGVVTAAFGRGLLAALARTLVSAAVMLVVYRLSAADPYTCGMLRCIFTALITFVPGAVCYLLLLFLPGRLKRKFCRKEGS